MLRLRPGPETGAIDDIPSDPPRTPAGAAPSPAAERLFVVATVLAVLPIVVATTRAVRSGWLPIGDNAYFAVRARDVLTDHHPLLGTWTSASISAGADFNNPGPLLFDLLAPAAKLLGSGAGVAVGAAALNAASVIGIALVGRRRGGAVVGIAAALVAAALCWTMGSQLLFDPWQPHSLLLPFLLLLLLTWSLACGDLAALPWAVLVASLVVQTHLSYAVLVAALGAWGAAGLGLALRRLSVEDRARWPARRRRAGRTVVVAAVVLALCWAQPLVEEVTADGDGNLTRLARHAGGSPDTLGPGLAVRVVAGVVVAPPLWLRPSFTETVPGPAADGPSGPGFGRRPPDVPSTAVAGALLAGLAGVLALSWVLARRRGDHTSAGAVVTAAVALAVGVVTAWALPLTSFGVLPHQLRWLWPVAAFTTLALATCVLRSRLVGEIRPVVPAAALTALVAVTAIANLPATEAESGPAADEWAIPVMRDLAAQMGVLEDEGTLLVDLTGVRFAEPFSGPVIAELQRRGIPFVFDDEGLVRQFGESRRAEGTPQRLFVREGGALDDVPAGGRRVALVDGLDDAGEAELAALCQEVLGHLRDLGGVPLEADGRAALERGDLPVAAADPDALTTRPEALADGRELAHMVEQGYLALDEGWSERFRRFAELQRRHRFETVALHLVPFAAGGTGS